MKRLIALTLLVAGALTAQTQSAIRPNPGFNRNFVPRNDDGSSSLQPLGFTVNFFGNIRTHAFVNNNGNITFDSALSTFTPFGLTSTQREIIAAFFADVDTRPDGSNVVRYGNDTVNGRNAFGVNYLNVGYFANRVDKLNSFQLILIDRSDVGPGNFDIEFNYERIRWETGEASGGVNGLGGTPAAVGWSNGTGVPGTFFELEGSLLSGAFLDGGYRSLVRNRLNSSVPGRYIFRARNGQILEPLSISTGCPLPTSTVGAAYRIPFSFVGEGTNPRWSVLLDEGAAFPAGISFANGVLSGTPAAPGSTDFTIRLVAATEEGDQTVSRRCSLTAVLPRVNITTACPLPLATVGQPYSRSLQAAGARGPFRWSLLEGDSLPTGLALNSNGTITGTPATEGNYTFGLQVDSDNGLPATRFCSMSVAAPRLELTSGACSLPSATLGVPYTQALEVRGGTPPYTWTAGSRLPSGLSLSTAGRVNGIPLELAAIRFDAIATDSAGRTVQQNCSLNVNPSTINITTACPLPGGVTGQNYDQTLEASGGTAPYTWSQLGPLPAGLTLSPGGRISGRPMQGGPSSFRVLVTDAQGRTAAKACSVPVTRAAFALTSCPISNVTEGISFSRSLTAAGGQPPYIFVAQGGVLPQGVTLNTFGTLSGTATRPGTFNFDVNLIDSNGQSTVAPCALNVSPSPLRIGASCPLPDGRVGDPYTRALEVNGGLPPYQWSVVGELPQGLRLSSSGTVSGTPLTAGEGLFAVRVADAENRSVTVPCSVNIEQPSLPSISISPLPGELAPASIGPRVTVSLGRAYSLPVRGFLNLEVRPDTGSIDATVNRADPRLRFANGQTRFPFVIQPGQTQVNTSIISTGTVASEVIVSLQELQVGTTQVPTTSAPRVFRVPRTLPVITDACLVQAGEGVNVRVTGYSTTRGINRANLTYTPAGGAQTTLSRDVSGEASNFFSGDESVRNGGAFTLLLPFANTGAVTTGSFTLQNSVGATAARNLSRCTN
jgi:hypothetical protein